MPQDALEVMRDTKSLSFGTDFTDVTLMTTVSMMTIMEMVKVIEL